MSEHSRIYAEIDLDAVRYNMDQMKQHLGEGAKLLAVIKADGYGHGAEPIAKLLDSDEDVWGYASATVEEAEEIQEAGVSKPILILGCVFPEHYETIARRGIRAAVFTKEMAEQMSEAAGKAGCTVYFHIKIDTGMGRLGFPVSEETADLIKEISELPNVCLEGMFTHFSKADETDKSYTEEQYRKFCRMREMVEERGIEIPYYHCDNSAGIIDFPDWKQDLVRAGISMYGMYPSDEVEQAAVDLKPALRLVSHISFVKEVEPGMSISYGGTYTTKKKMRIATIPVGYADGYSRGLSNKSDVLIRGKRARVLGRVCMDQFMVDVTEIPDAEFMDPVVLIGKDGEDEIRVEELSALCGRFNYEFVCCLNKRIPRIYKKQ